MGNFLWGRGEDGEYFLGTGWGWGKFYGDGAGMGTILFTMSLSTVALVDMNFSKMSLQRKLRRTSSQQQSEPVNSVGWMKADGKVVTYQKRTIFVKCK